jgi:hypothetical protein
MYAYVVHSIVSRKNRQTVGKVRRVGQNRVYTPYMTVYMVISLPKMPYTHRIYMVLANPTNTVCIYGSGLLSADGVGKGQGLGYNALSD